MGAAGLKAADAFRVQGLQGYLTTPVRFTGVPHYPCKEGVEAALQGYFAHQKTYLPRTLP